MDSDRKDSHICIVKEEYMDFTHAASVNRDDIMECEKIGIPINKFAEPCINAMLTINDRVGL
jgi:predicted hydrolase (HD superfamily)